MLLPALLQNGLAEVVSKSRKQIKERKNRTKSLRGVKKNSGAGQQGGLHGWWCGVVAAECMDALALGAVMYERGIKADY